MLYAMGTPVPPSRADVKTPDAWWPPASPLVLDVGANVGTFAMLAAYYGARVAAFERERRRRAGRAVRRACVRRAAGLRARGGPGSQSIGGRQDGLPETHRHVRTPAARTHAHPRAAMESNLALLRSTLCENPWLLDRVALYGTGLGTKCA
jgi:hypothetical protein